MKALYRGFEIDVHKEKCLGGWQMTYYSVFTADGFEVTSGCSEDETNLHTQMKGWKRYVDDLLVSPHDYLEALDIEHLRAKGVLGNAGCEGECSDD